MARPTYPPVRFAAPAPVQLLDEDLPAAASIMGSDIGQILELALGQAGATIQALERRQVLYRPGRRLVARFAARVAWNGHVSDETIVALADARGLPDGCLVVGGGGDDLRVGVWRWPFDPYLPGLASAMDPERVRGVIADLGGQPGPMHLTPMAYRPGRRAVIRATTGHQTLFLKVVPPDEAEALHRRHLAVAGHLPAPASLGWSPSLGLVALEALSGQVLRDAIDGGHPLPAGDHVLDMLGHIPSVDEAVPQREPRPSLVHRAVGHARTIEATLPGQRDRLRRLVDRLGEGSAQELATIHGDLHDGQLLVRDGEISGLLDIDGLGPGDRIDDPATLIAHLSALEMTRPRSHLLIRGYSESIVQAAGRLGPADELARRIAATCVGLATGPFRVQQPHWRAATLRLVALAERWLVRADRATARGF